tara:strand:- start:3208 stop:4533 length:1326 start_codon:yes stop_codon:yes gene_type:complete
MSSQSMPLVSIVGRPNVGKSTLFNRITGQRSAIVSDISGTTRDRVLQETEWGGSHFTLVDTGGLELFPESVILKQVEEQILYAIQESDVIIVLVDISVEITLSDREICDLVRKTGKPIVLAANKSDNDNRETLVSDLYELGLGNPIPISAYHNKGIDDLMANVLKNLPLKTQFSEPDSDLNLSIIGRTNVGKSSLINTLTGEKRAIVSEIAGTTRDALDTIIKYEDQDITLIDTAGIRRRGKIEQGIEKYSILRAVRAINRSHVAGIVIDATESATAQDTHIASYVIDALKGFFIIVNKWDTSKELGINKQTITREIREAFKFASYAPICFTSALNGTGINDVLNTALRVQSEWSKEIPRPDVRKTIMSAVAEHPPATRGKRELKIYSAVQDGSRPPSFTFFVNHSDMIHFSYQRYLENILRNNFGFEGSPLRVRFKGWKT